MHSESPVPAYRRPLVLASSAQRGEKIWFAAVSFAGVMTRSLHQLHYFRASPRAVLARFGQLIASGCVVLNFWAFAASAAPPEIHGLESIRMAGKRPANFYTSVAQLDPAVCRQILASLNGEFSIEYKNYDVNPRASVDTDLLLTSTLQLPWTRKLVREPESNSKYMGRLDIARAAYRKLTFYRLTLQTSSLTVNTLMLTDAAPATLPDERPLDESVVKKIGGQLIAFDLTKFPSIGTHLGVEGRLAGPAVNVAMPAKGGAAPQPLLLNVVSVGRQLFILLADAIEMEIEAPKVISGHIDLYVLRFYSINDMRPVCQFRGD